MKFMNKYGVLSLIFFTACVAITLFSKPNVDAPLTIFLYFVFFFIFLYFTFTKMLNFLGLKNRVKFYALSMAAPLFTVQVLATFHSLRIVELLLIVATSIGIIFYFSRVKT